MHYSDGNLCSLGRAFKSIFEWRHLLSSLWTLFMCSSRSLTNKNVISHSMHGRHGCGCCTTCARGTNIILLWDLMWPAIASWDGNTFPHWVHCVSLFIWAFSFFIWNFLWAHKACALLKDLSHWSQPYPCSSFIVVEDSEARKTKVLLSNQSVEWIRAWDKYHDFIELSERDIYNFK